MATECKHAVRKTFSKYLENSVDPDQLASPEAS